MCNSHAQVRQSHYDKVSGQLMATELKNIYGMLMLLAMGLGSSCIAFVAGRVV